MFPTKLLPIVLPKIPSRDSSHLLLSASLRLQSPSFQTASFSSSSVPRRALLYVPGSDEKKITKAAKEVHPDTICLDCEDGVASNKKPEARLLIRKLLSELDFGRSEVAVRVNPVSSGIAGDDLAAALSAGRLPDALVLPKVDEPGEIHWFHKQVAELLRGRQLSRPISLITMCETALGLLNLRSVLEAACGLTPGGLLSPGAVILGGDDFAASIGAVRSPGAFELLHVRQSMLVHCAAFGVQAIDIVKIDFRDLKALEEEALIGASMGYTGKQVIHPMQVPVVQAAFSATPEAVAEARELVEAFEKEAAAGRGAFSFKGRMIDMPSVLQARNVLARAAS